MKGRTVADGPFAESKEEMVTSTFMSRTRPKRSPSRKSAQDLNMAASSRFGALV
jgi:hypothetical protein